MSTTFFSRSLRRAAALTLALMAIALQPSVRATLSEPDHVVYGTIFVNSTPVTAAMTNFVVELRRTTNGPVITSYRMGENPGFGNYYSINVPMESLDPESIIQPGLVDPNASLPGQTLHLTVRERTTIRYQANFVAGEYASQQRINFGTGAVGPSQLELWQVFHLGVAGVNMNQNLNGKAQSLQMDYIAGTNPHDTNSVFKLNIARNGGTEISFHALRAEGAGYAGLTRRYDLEYSTNLVAGTWRGVPGHTNLVGNNQTIIYSTPANAGNGPFYRAQIRLTRP